MKSTENYVNLNSFFKDEFDRVAVIVQIGIKEVVMLLKELSLYQLPADGENVLTKLQSTTNIKDNLPPTLKYLQVLFIFLLILTLSDKFLLTSLSFQKKTIIFL